MALRTITRRNSFWDRWYLERWRIGILSNIWTQARSAEEPQAESMRRMMTFADSLFLREKWTRDCLRRSSKLVSMRRISSENIWLAETHLASPGLDLTYGRSMFHKLKPATLFQGDPSLTQRKKNRMQASSGGIHLDNGPRDEAWNVIVRRALMTWVKLNNPSSMNSHFKLMCSLTVAAPPLLMKTP